MKPPKPMPMPSPGAPPAGMPAAMPAAAPAAALPMPSANTHNADNRLPQKAMHPRGRNRGLMKGGPGSGGMGGDL